MATENSIIGKHLKDALTKVKPAATGNSAGGAMAGRRRDPTSFVIDAKRIRRDPTQVRQSKKDASDPDVRALAESIDSDGLRAAPEVRYREESDMYELVTGERRFTAMTDVLGWSEVPVRVINIEPEQLLWIQLHENVHRQDLSPLELAVALQKASDEGYSITEIADRLKKSKSYVQKALTIAEKLSNPAKKLLVNSAHGSSLDAVYTIATLPEADQASIAKELTESGLTQRQLRERTKEHRITKSPTHKAKGGRPIAAKGFSKTWQVDDFSITVKSKTATADITAVEAALKKLLREL